MTRMITSRKSLVFHSPRDVRLDCLFLDINQAKQGEPAQTSVRQKSPRKRKNRHRPSGRGPGRHKMDQPGGQPVQNGACTACSIQRCLSVSLSPPGPVIASHVDEGASCSFVWWSRILSLPCFPFDWPILLRSITGKPRIYIFLPTTISERTVRSDHVFWVGPCDPPRPVPLSSTRTDRAVPNAEGQYGQQ